jgi:phosphoribosyl-ATP pyrophosphohydrolase/phosphoribosyl-AMP cyclohydrolase
MIKNLEKLDWEKSGGILPAIIQHAKTGQVLMLGYMNNESLEQTLETKKVTFFSRSKQRLWTKGETSGNELNLVDCHVDCDFDTLLIKAVSSGPACHTGTETCFVEDAPPALAFLKELQSIIQERYQNPKEKSYTTELFKSGRLRIAQKVGEEAVETVIAATSENKENLINESADLVYHLMVLLTNSGLSLNDISSALEQRHRK